MDIYQHLKTIRTTRREDKYSANLYRWLVKSHRKHWTAPNVFIQLGHDICQVESFNPDQTQAPAIYLGMPDNGDLFGSHLSRILTMGAKAETACYTGFALPHRAIDITQDFWERYLLLGKCAIDPEHTLYGSERYDTSNKHRQCRWCGRKEASHIEKQIVSKTVWLPLKTSLASENGL